MFAACVVVSVLLAPYVASSAAVDFAIRSRHRYGEGGVVESRLPLLGLLKGACGSDCWWQSAYP